MPTAAQFLALADRFARMQADADAALAAVEGAAAGAVVGGTLADRLARTLAETDASLRRQGRALATTAASARDRAEQCREYTAAMAAYRVELARWEAAAASTPSLLVIGPPVRPQRPGPWVAES